MINQPRIATLADALVSLAPNAQWVMEGNSYESIVWNTPDIAQPSQEAAEQEILRLQAEYNATEYQRLRSLEYPDFRDYLDGIVKGDQEQIDAYIAACLAVKEKYPKPSES